VQVAPRTYRSWKSKTPAARTVSDAAIVNALKDTAEKPESLYGRRKMTAWLRRKGHDVARCTVDRLMRDEAMNGLVRGRKPKAGAAAKDSQRAPDLLNRDFTAARPNVVWVTDFTYVRTWAGFAYVAFAIDVFSRAIVGWHGSTIKDTDMVLTTLKMALWRRDQAGTPVPEGQQEDGLKPGTVQNALRRVPETREGLKRRGSEHCCQRRCIVSKTFCFPRH
jgi:putative transposase